MKICLGGYLKLVTFLLNLLELFLEYEGSLQTVTDQSFDMFVTGHSIFYLHNSPPPPQRPPSKNDGNESPLIFVSTL